MRANRSQVSLGVILVLVAVLLLAQAGIPSFSLGAYGYAIGGIVSIAVGLVLLSGSTYHPWWSLGLVAFGVLLILAQWGYLPGSVWAYLPGVVVLVLALSLIFPQVSRGTRPNQQREGESAQVLLSEVTTRVTTPTFSEGSLNVVLGSGTYDLRGTQIVDEAVLNVSVVLGGVEVIVPPDVEVDNAVTSIIGGVELKGVRAPQDWDKAGPRLRIDGSVILGGIEVVYTP